MMGRTFVTVAVTVVSVFKVAKKGSLSWGSGVGQDTDR